MLNKDYVIIILIIKGSVNLKRIIAGVIWLFLTIGLILGIVLYMGSNIHRVNIESGDYESSEVFHYDGKNYEKVVVKIENETENYYNEHDGINTFHELTKPAKKRSYFKITVNLIDKDEFFLNMDIKFLGKINKTKELYSFSLKSPKTELFDLSFSLEVSELDENIVAKSFKLNMTDDKGLSNNIIVKKTKD